MDPSFLSLVPALVAIGLAFLTREVLLSLFLGVVSGGLVMWLSSGDVHEANFVQQFLLASARPEILCDDLARLPVVSRRADGSVGTYRRRVAFC